MNRYILGLSLFLAFGSVNAQTPNNEEVITLNITGQEQSGNANANALSAFDQDMISVLHLGITMPQAGDYKAVILETDGRLPTQMTFNKISDKMVSGNDNVEAESSILALTLDGVLLSDDNLVLDVYMAMLPVDLTSHTLMVRVYDAQGNVYPVTQELGKRDFKVGKTTEFTLTAENAECSGLPLLFVNTADRKTIDSKEVWLEGTSCAIVYQDGSILDAPGKIKGRGNNTWSKPKKPFNVKFTEKQKPFGFPGNKSWALLADFYDRSLLRTAFMSAASRAADLDWTINYQHVNLYLNGNYNGVYVFTDKVEASSNRIEVEDDGFIIEDDNYYKQENLYFKSLLNNNFTFKYPDDEEDIKKGDANFVFIKDFIDQAEAAMLLLENDSSSTEYLNFIDITSFAKFHVASASVLLFDPNRFYVLPSRQSKLKMMPLWDAEWSLGLRPRGWGETTWSLVEDTYWDYAFYFRYLMRSPAFKLAVKQEWANFKSNVEQVKNEMESVRQSISKAQAVNFKMWPTNRNYYNITFDTWEEEVAYVMKFFDDRVAWLDDYYNSWIIEDITGILSVDRLQRKDDCWYNLQGQRLDNPGKGLYIRNGKKVIVR